MGRKRDINSDIDFEDQIKDHYEGEIETSQVGDASDTEIDASENLAEKASVDFEESGKAIVSRVVKATIDQSEFVPDTPEEDPLGIHEFIAEESVSPNSLDKHQVTKHSVGGGKVISRLDGNIRNN